MQDYKITISYLLQCKQFEKDLVNDMDINECSHFNLLWA